jgi:SAM-dependent methyltransferase
VPAGVGVLPTLASVACRLALADGRPFPPLALANRVGSLEEAKDPYAYYEDLGQRARAHILQALPTDWALQGKRILDFGCGAGRTLRHFLDEAETGEVWGCDIDVESIEWLDKNLSPPLRVFHNGPDPPLPQPDGYFDLIWAVSVFTHLVETWSDWLLELRRVLRPDGLLVATFMGEGMSELIAGETWDEERVGMNVLRYGQSWDLGGPMVLHSPWWIREHWGRGFEVLDVVPQGFATGSSIGQGIAVLRRSAGELSRDDLERVEPGHPRELTAIRHNVAQLRAEVADLRRGLDHQRSEAERQRLRAETLESTLNTVVQGRSWRITKPLRWGAEVTREFRHGRR